MTKTMSEPDDEFDEPLPASLWKTLNLPEPRRIDDRFAPEVDRELLLRLVRKELPKGMVRAAYRLIHAFDSWKTAYAEIIIEEFRRNQPPESNQSQH
jgi:hypothetical protein